MKYLAILALCASCQSASFSNLYVNVTDSEFRDSEADELGNVSGIEVGYQSGDGEDGLAVGLVSDIAVRAQSEDSSVDGVNIEYDTLGIRTGLRYYADTGSRAIQPYIGAALLWSSYNFESDMVEGDEASDNDTALVWMVGVESQVTDDVRLSVGYSMTDGVEPTVNDEDYDLDDGTISFGIGWSF